MINPNDGPTQKQWPRGENGTLVLLQNPSLTFMRRCAKHCPKKNRLQSNHEKEQEGSPHDSISERLKGNHNLWKGFGSDIRTGNRAKQFTKVSPGKDQKKTDESDSNSQRKRKNKKALN